MRIEKTLTFDRPDGAAITVVVKELTLEEIVGWLADPARLVVADEDQVIAAMVARLSGGDVSLSDLRHFAGLDAAAAGHLAPSELRQVIAAAREINEVFFWMQDVLVLSQQTPIETSYLPPVRSPDPGTAAPSGTIPGASL